MATFLISMFLGLLAFLVALGFVVIRINRWLEDDWQRKYGPKSTDPNDPTLE